MLDIIDVSISYFANVYRADWPGHFHGLIDYGVALLARCRQGRITPTTLLLSESRRNRWDLWALVKLEAHSGTHKAGLKDVKDCKGIPRMYIYIYIYLDQYVYTYYTWRLGNIKSAAKHKAWGSKMELRALCLLQETAVKNWLDSSLRRQTLSNKKQTKSKPMG